MIQTTKEKTEILNLDINKQFPTSIGVEYALVPKGYFVSGYDNNYLDEKLQNEINSFLKKNNVKNMSKAKAERGAVEISSSILRSYQELSEFWETANVAFASCSKKMVANTTAINKRDGESYYIEGGGGHIHIGIPVKDREKIYDNFLIGMLNRPYIPWFFSEFCDNDSLNSSFFNAFEEFSENTIDNYKAELVKFVSRGYKLEWGMGPIQIRNTAVCTDSKPAKNTVEIRCLAAYKDFQQLIDYVDFALALYNFFSLGDYNCSHFTNGTRSRSQHISYCDEVKNNPKFAIEEFNNFLIKINLDPIRYKRYHKNFKERLKYGKLHTFESRG